MCVGSLVSNGVHFSPSHDKDSSFVLRYPSRILFYHLHMGEVFFTTIPYPRLTFGRTLLVFFFYRGCGRVTGIISDLLSRMLKRTEASQPSVTLEHVKGGASLSRRKRKMVGKGARDQIREYFGRSFYPPVVCFLFYWVDNILSSLTF